MGFQISFNDDTEKRVIALEGLIKSQSALLVSLQSAMQAGFLNIDKEIKAVVDIVQATKDIIKAASDELTTVAATVTDIAAGVAALKGSQVPNGTNVQDLANALEAQATAINAANQQLKDANAAIEAQLTPPQQP